MRLCRFLRVNKWDGGQRVTIRREAHKQKTVQEEALWDQSVFFPSRLKTLTVPALSI